MFRSATYAVSAILVSCFAIPAAAQTTNLCSGAGANGQWLGGQEEASDISTSPGYLEQLALVLLSSEYVGLFTVSQAGEYRIEAEGSGGSGDTVIDVVDTNGTMITSDDDSGGNSASRAEAFFNPGTYCVLMRSFDGAPLTAFVRASRLDQEPLTDGFLNTGVNEFGSGDCDLGQGQPLVLGQPASNSWNAQDTYSLTLDQPTALSITAENEDADPILTLFDANGNWIAENDDFDGLNSRIDLSEPLPAGQYCILLDLYGDERVPITVTAKVYDPQEVQLGLYARGDASPPLDGSYPVVSLGALETSFSKDINVSGDAIWFSFDVSDTSLALVEANAQTQGDPVLVMYDQFGSQIGYNDDAGGSLDSLLTVRVQPGTYLVAVRQLDNSTTGTIRMVFERYVRAQ